MAVFQASVVQASPAFFDKAKTLQRIGDLIRDCASKKSSLILFPEVIIPGYPRGLTFGTNIGGRTPEGREMFLSYWENSVEVPGPETQQIAAWAKNAKAFVVVGVTEKDKVSDTLYCSLLYFSPEGQLIHRHRKIKPTAAERIIWGEGDGSDLQVVDTPLGKMGGLICWENYMPAARMALYEQGIELYLAPTADCRDSWQATLTHIACESRCFVLGCNQYLTADQYPPEYQKILPTTNSGLPSSGGSVIINPLGKVLAGPLFGQEGIVSAEIDTREIIKAKMDFDVIGHYARPDVFTFSWNKKPQ
ncbi:MAG: carbon-nitrogen hydrolase family protein [Cyclobacteriaceae bacterium]|nr:nitrilase [Cytophagales bacterium]HNP78728.1 carbon-nitrogen hydrolase family protein [Cyclobacteriaceae bacterium]